MMQTEFPDRLLKISEVIVILNIGESTFWEGVRQGHYPAPIKLSSRTTRWRLSDIMSLIS